MFSYETAAENSQRLEKLFGFGTKVIPKHLARQRSTIGKSIHHCKNYWPKSLDQIARDYKDLVSTCKKTGTYYYKLVLYDYYNLCCSP